VHGIAHLVICARVCCEEEIGAHMDTNGLRWDVMGDALLQKEWW
jgi:hypothetical protein